jgi:hypothetical protein
MTIARLIVKLSAYLEEYPKAEVIFRSANPTKESPIVSLTIEILGKKGKPRMIIEN